MHRRYHLSAPFVVFCGLVLAMGVGAMHSQNNLLFYIFGAMVAALLVSGVVSALMMASLEVHRLDPGHGSVGEPLVVQYRLSNRSRLFPAFDLLIEDLPGPAPPAWRRLARLAREVVRQRFDLRRTRSSLESAQRAGTTFWRLMRPARAWVMHVGPGESVHGEAVYWPLGRGEARFGWVQVRTTFPLGLVRKSLTIAQPASTLVYPRLYTLPRGLLRTIGAQGPLGTRVTARSGGGDDYYGLREYRPGEALRHIAWKRSASRDDIVCIERTRPSPPRLRVMLDLRRPTESLRVEPAGLHHARQREEDAISLAASILHAADAAGYEAGLSVPGSDMPEIPVRRGRWHLWRMMSALAAIDLDAPRRSAPARSPLDLERVGLVVIHPDRVDPSVGRRDAWHLTAGQLTQLTIGPIGWDPGRNRALAPARESAA